ncbi:hypothetical protein C2G38_2161151 [Gigaspora rosea]|uniref:Uncharacterized protein n=1 Tax=Gigaspora rosea TaxID=44941 RepID=A0A397VZ45_9GLOM|nr:hypothetical protein C2G38_2161151 [Gigaspora rosea]
MISICFDNNYNDDNDNYLLNSFQTNSDNCLEIDTLKHRHFATTFNQQQFSKSGYEQVPLEPIDFDENRKLYNPLRLPKNKVILSFWQQYNDILILVFFTVLSFWMRFYLISYSSLVVWDEGESNGIGSSQHQEALRSNPNYVRLGPKYFFA